MQQQGIAPLAGLPLDNFREHMRQPFTDSGNLRNFARGVAQNIGDPLGMAFHRRGAVAVAANAKRIFGRDLHEIGRLPKDARDFPIFQI